MVESTPYAFGSLQITKLRNVLAVVNMKLHYIMIAHYLPSLYSNLIEEDHKTVTCYQRDVCIIECILQIMSAIIQSFVWVQLII